jgi:diguanylate cyclase (GGDEF)-like protein
MFWRHVSLRRVLLSALILLGGWGLFSSLYQVKQSWGEYERSRNMADWAYTAGQLMTFAQHLAYERGRTAVVLRGEMPVSETDKKFIDGRRDLADQAIADLHDKIASIPEIGHAAFHAKWEKILEMRKLVDRDKVLPLVQRDPELPSHWTQEVTALLMEAETLARNLVRHYRQNEGANRHTQLGFLTYRLRLNMGAEASMIAQQVASNMPMPQRDLNTILEMRGTQKAIWAEIDRNVDYLDNTEMKALVAALKQRHDALRVVQDSVLEAWENHRQVTVAINELTAASPPLLDGISDLMTYATREANRAAEARKESALKVLFIHIAFSVSVLIVMLLSIFYVLIKVVRPLEAVDIKLRRINFPDSDIGNLQANQIERLCETAKTLVVAFREKKRLEDELRELAFYDSLTQLPNRRLMEDRLRQKIFRAKRHKSLLALLFIDLDNFKSINDENGHEVGDWLLCGVSDRIVSCVRESDTAARLGGDEFVVLIPDLVTPEDALAVAEKIRNSLDQPFYTPDGQRFEISSSIGVALYPNHAENERDLMRIGDEAMFLAKNAGRNRVEMLTYPIA